MRVVEGWVKGGAHVLCCQCVSREGGAWCVVVCGAEGSGLRLEAGQAWWPFWECDLAARQLHVWQWATEVGRQVQLHGAPRCNVRDCPIDLRCFSSWGVFSLPLVLESSKDLRRDSSWPRQQSIVHGTSSSACRGWHLEQLASVKTTSPLQLETVFRSAFRKGGVS